MARDVPLLLAATLACGCASSRPYNDVGFAAISSLSSLDGRYANLGETGEDVPPVYLSSIIWPRDDQLDHLTVVEIEIHALDEATLWVWACNDTAILRKSEFVAGRDFEVESGRLRLGVGTRVAGTEPGEPVLGIHTRTLEVGLDMRGNGKLRSKEAIVGLAYLIFPIAAGEKREVRFVRLDGP